MKLMGLLAVLVTGAFAHADLVTHNCGGGGQIRKQISYELLARDTVVMIVGMLFALIVCGVVAGGCIAFSRYVVCRRFDAKRVKECEELRAAGETLRPVARRTWIVNALTCFLIGAIAELFVGDWRGVDPIFRQHVPWYGVYEVLQTGMMFSSLGLASHGVTFPKTRRRVVLLVLAALELAFVIHLANAYSFWGHGMSVLACVRGYARRCYFDGFGAALIVVTFALAVPLTLCVKSFRLHLTRCGLTCGRYLGDVVRLVGWFGLLGLLVYETLILMWLNLAF